MKLREFFPLMLVITVLVTLTWFSSARLGSGFGRAGHQRLLAGMSFPAPDFKETAKPAPIVETKSVGRCESAKHTPLPVGGQFEELVRSAECQPE